MESQQPNPQVLSTPPENAVPQRTFFSLPLLAVASIFVILAAAGGGWYMYGPSTTTPETSTVKITGPKVIIGHNQWPGYVAFFVARDQGYFADEGVDVELREYPSLTEASKDYQKGVIQGSMNLGLDAIQEAQAGLDHKIVLLVDHSYGADGIVARPGIKNISDIKGKKVAYEFGTLEEFFLRYVLQESGLSLSDIEGVNLNAEEAANALIKKDVDVAVTFEPFISTALSETGGTKLYTSQQAPDLISDVLTFRSDFIAQYPDTVAAIVRAYLKAVDFNKFNPIISHSILAKAYGISTEDVVLQLEGVKIADKDANRIAFSKDTGAQSLYTNLQEIAQFAQTTNKQAKPFDSTTLIDPTFVNASQTTKQQ